MGSTEFRDCILARQTMNTAGLQAYNMNSIRGDINGGVQDWRQLFTRPVSALRPNLTPAGGVKGGCVVTMLPRQALADVFGL